GAAEEKALFTYESIPRSTFLVMDVVLDDYREAFPKTSKTAKDNLLLCGPWGCPLDVVKAGLNMMEWLGVGGMGTRGFGRLAMVGQPKESSLTGTTENRSGQTKEVSV
ncbi:MAG TPA: type III-B CRISPR module RAMP protein Cmr4, partial [Desulfobacterales bacterium]|nr:type III-B CRISPR module RAMP protein Cmr4 [Desulfobacterales bacterium]